MSDPYAVVYSRSFDVVKPQGGGVLFIATDDGSIKNPFGLARNLVVDAAIKHSTFYSKVRERIQAAKDKQEAERKRREALDSEVQRILDNDANHQAMLKWIREDKVLQKEADDHFNRLLHISWELLPDWYRPYAKEPPEGRWNPEAWDTYMSRKMPDFRFLSIKPTPLEDARSKLDNAYSDYMAKIKKKRPRPSLAYRSSGYVPEEPPQ